MKLLFDQNLPPRLVEILADLFPESAHVQTLGLDCSPDTALWEFARENEFVLVTKDADFSDRSALLGHPPKVVWIRLGNCSASDIQAALGGHYKQIEAFGENEDLGVITVF